MVANAAMAISPSKSQSYLDYLIYEQIHWAHADIVEIEQAHKLAVHSWLDGCDIYARLSAAGIQSSGTPLVPSYLFKSQNILCRSSANNAPKECVSSGTLGSRSIVLRDDRTLERFVGSVRYAVGQMLGEEHGRRRAFVLGPPSVEIDSLWFSYVLSLVDLIYETRFFVRNERVDYHGLFNALSSERYYEPILVGPPALVNDFMTYLAANDLRLDLGEKEAFIITAGGWKARQNEDIGRVAFRARCVEAFRIDESRIRDSFNMVELNSVLIECEHHRMHVPPWLKVAALNPATLTETDGERVLAFVDPTSCSYPGAILSEDVGRVSGQDSLIIARILRWLRGRRRRGRRSGSGRSGWRHAANP